MAWTSIWLDSLIKKMLNYRSSLTNVSNRIKYEHLAPKTDIKNEEAKSFNESLDYSLNNPQIHNVAITGSYGSGKSSLISSYIGQQKKHERRFLQISLASFTLEKTIDKQTTKDNDIEEKVYEDAILKDNESDNAETEIETPVIDIENNDINKKKESTSSTYIPFSTLQKIEKSIIQQMFYRESGFKLPFSRFKRIRNLSFLLNLALTGLVFILFLFPFKFFKEDLWIKAKSISIFNSGIRTGLLFWVFFVCSLISLFFIIRFFNKLKINKLGFQNIDIDLDVKDKNSLLNKYVDEILYYFEVTDYEVVVFEDLDRFKNTEIFIKLRELNTLLNNYKKLKNHNRKKITFVYALLDDVFIDKSRTKFFEFIIPVIPVIDYQNSGDYLLERKKANETTAFSDLEEPFLLDIGLYVNDMRLLKNCINEFKIYDETINKYIYEKQSFEMNTQKNEVSSEQKSEPHDRKKIFSLVLYKNLYPNDFSALQNNEGYLYSIFQNKYLAVKEEKKKLEKDLIDIEHNIENIQKHSHLQIEDLRRRYVYKMLQSVSHFYRINDSDYLSEEAFKKIRETNTLPIYESQYNRYNGSTQVVKIDYPITFSTIENSIDSNLTYEEKASFIKQNESDKIEKLQTQVSEKKKKIKELTYLPIAKIISEYNDTSFIPENDKINRKLIVYLLRNECIDENYFDYISHFYPESLSRTDKDFILLIRNHSEPIFETPLIKIENILRRLQHTDWSNPAILNNSLLTFLLGSDITNLETFIETMIKHDSNKDNESFFKQFDIPSDEKLKIFYTSVYKLISKESQWVSKLFGKENLDKFYKFFILVDVLDNKDYTQFIKKHINFLYRDLSNEEKEIVKNKLLELKIKFNLDDETFKYDIFKILIENNLYDLTADNLSKIINSQSDRQDKEITNYLSMIKKLANPIIEAYVNENLPKVIQSIILPIGLKLTEDEEIFISLLENESLSIIDKQKLIENNQTRISDITKVNQEFGYEDQVKEKIFSIWDALFINNKVLPVWDNILLYFKKNEDYTYLIKFLNINENTKFLSTSLLLSEDEFIDTESKKYQVVKSFYDFIISCKTLDMNSFTDLMKNCKFTYSKLGDYGIGDKKIEILIKNKNLLFSVEKYKGIKNSANNLLPAFSSSYFNDILANQQIITIDDLALLFNSKEINNDQKSELLSSNIDALKNATEEVFLKTIAKYIISNNITRRITIPFSSIVNAFTNKDEDTEIIITLLTLQFDNLSNEEIINALNGCRKPYSSLCIKTGEHETLKLKDNELQLCKKLARRDLISSVTQYKDKYKIIRKRR